jgi:hypothetical protein
VRKLGTNTLSIRSESFAIFILTHGRPINVKTMATLQRAGYTGKTYLVVDDEDKTADKYIANFGKDRVVVFNKKEMADQVDEGNNFNERRTITHARNACFKIAKELGIKYFMELDDDYTAFDFRLIIGDKEIVKPTKNLDKLLLAVLEYYKNTEASSISLSQGGDFIGGMFNGKQAYRFSKRKCMNSFICSTDRPFQFIGAMNEDVNTYLTLGSRGKLFLTICVASITQTATQSQKSGITDMYLRFGTYCKAFTTVMMCPSFVKISMMNTSNPRIHHSISWKNAVPLIISEACKKAS